MTVSKLDDYVIQRNLGMKTLCFQVQPKRSGGIDVDAVAALMARLAKSSDMSPNVQMRPLKNV